MLLRKNLHGTGHFHVAIPDVKKIHAYLVRVNYSWEIPSMKRRYHILFIPIIMVLSCETCIDRLTLTVCELSL